MISLLVLSTQSAHLEDVALPFETSMLFNTSQLSITSVSNLVVAENIGKGVVLASNRQNLFIVTKENGKLTYSLVESISSSRAPLLSADAIDVNTDGNSDISYVSQGGGEIMWLKADDVGSYDNAIALALEVTVYNHTYTILLFLNSRGLLFQLYHI